MYLGFYLIPINNLLILYFYRIIYDINTETSNAFQISLIISYFILFGVSISHLLVPFKLLLGQHR